LYRGQKENITTAPTPSAGGEAGELRATIFHFTPHTNKNETQSYLYGPEKNITPRPYPSGLGGLVGLAAPL
jgi:hypothetical protein